MPDKYVPHKHHDRVIKYVEYDEKVKGIVKYLIGNWGFAKTNEWKELMAL